MDRFALVEFVGLSDVEGAGGRSSVGSVTVIIV